MSRLAIIFTALILISGCAKSSIHAKTTTAQSNVTFKNNLIEKGTFHWHKDKLPPPLKEVGRFKVGKLGKQNVVIYKNNLFIGDKLGWLYKVNNKNIVKRLKKVDSAIVETGCVTKNILYFSDINGNIYSYNIVHNSILKQKANAPIYSAAVCRNGIAYFFDDNSTLYAVKNGNILWSTHFFNSLISMKGSATPYIGNGIIAATSDGYIYKVRNGSIVNSAIINPNVGNPNTLHDIDSTPVVDLIGNIYAASVNGIIAAYDKNFNMLWRTRGSPTVADLVLSPAELIVSGTDGTLSAYDTAAGSLLWKIKLSKKPLISGAIMLDNTIYQPTIKGYVYAVSYDGKILWKVKLDSSGFISRPVFHDGKLYLSARDGTIYELK